MALLEHRLDWSHSRHKVFQACRRQYWFRYYGSWGGWDHAASEASRAAYRLGKIQSAAEVAGQIVHETIDAMLLRLKYQATVMQEAEASALALRSWEAKLAQSASEGWRDGPKYVACLFEDYYQSADRERKLANARRTILDSITHFCASGTWTQLQRSKPTCWIGPEESSPRWTTPLVAGVPCCGSIDLGYRVKGKDGAQSCRLFDWRTGQARASDHDQMQHQALFAEAVWALPAEATRCQLVYLGMPDGEEEVTITSASLQQARDRTANTYLEMRSLLLDQDQNLPLPLAHFPVTENAAQCRSCKFQEICPDRPSRSVETSNGD